MKKFVWVFLILSQVVLADNSKPANTEVCDASAEIPFGGEKDMNLGRSVQERSSTPVLSWNLNNNHGARCSTATLILFPEQLPLVKIEEEFSLSSFFKRSPARRYLLLPDKTKIYSCDNNGDALFQLLNEILKGVRPGVRSVFISPIKSVGASDLCFDQVAQFHGPYLTKISIASKNEDPEVLLKFEFANEAPLIGPTKWFSAPSENRFDGPREVSEWTARIDGYNQVIVNGALPNFTPMEMVVEKPNHPVSRFIWLGSGRIISIGIDSDKLPKSCDPSRPSC